MVASALQSSRPLYRVIGRSGAVVRADVELDSAQVGDLVYGAVVVAADASVAKTSAGVSRRRIVKPVGGYVSSRVLRPLSSDEVDAHRRAQDAAAAEARAAAAEAPAAAAARRREAERLRLGAERREASRRDERAPISARRRVPRTPPKAPVTSPSPTTTRGGGLKPARRCGRLLKLRRTTAEAVSYTHLTLPTKA